MQSFLETIDADGRPWARRIGPLDRTSLLSSFCQLSAARLTAATSRTLRDEVDRYLERIAARGTTGRFLRDARALVTDFLDHLHDQGTITARVARRGVVSTLARQVVRYTSTIPRWGLAVLTLEVLLLAAAIAVRGPGTWTWRPVATATELFGLGTVVTGRPLLGAFAAAVLCFALLTCLLDTREVHLAAPVVALLGGIAVAAAYVEDERAAVVVVLAGLMGLLWLITVLALDRVVGTLVAPNLVLIPAAVSVVWFAVEAVRAGHGLLVVAVAAGLVQAAHPGPKLRISVGSLDFSQGTTGIQETSSLRRVPIDERLFSLPIAFAVSAPILGVNGTRAVAGMALAQVLTVALQARASLDVPSVERSLASLGAGTPLTGEGLQQWVTRHRWSFPVGRAVVLGAAATAVIADMTWPAAPLPPDSDPSSVDFLLLQLAGLMVLLCLRAFGTVVTPLASASALEEPTQRNMGASLVERARRLRQSKLRSLGIVAVTLAGYRALAALADVRDVLDFVADVWRTLT